MRIVDVPEFRPRRDLATCAPETTAAEAASVLAERNIGGLPVVNGDKLVGIFTERDLVRRVAAAGRDPKTTRLSEVMTRDVRTASPDDPVRGGIDTMINGGFRHLPVTDADGNLVGVLALRDFLTANWTQMLTRTRRHAVLAVARAPETYILLAGIAAYTALIVIVVALAL